MGDTLVLAVSPCGVCPVYMVYVCSLRILEASIMRGLTLQTLFDEHVLPLLTGKYNDKPDQYRCKPCATAHMTGSKVCQPWPSECNPLSPRWCALDASCKPVCRRGMYYDSKKKKCSRCPYGTFQPMPGTGCCRVRRCPAGMIPGPSRYNGIFPPLCVKKPETPPPSPARECYSSGTCRRTQGERAPPLHNHQQKPPHSVFYADTVSIASSPNTVSACSPLPLLSCSSAPH